MSAYYTTEIIDGNSRLLKCPDIACDMKALPGDVQLLVAPEVFAKYDAALLDYALSTMSDVI